MLEFKGISKEYRGGHGRALDSFDLRIENGEVYGFVGLNGAGKTTAIKIAAGVLNATEGTVMIDGVDLNDDRNDAIAKIGWVPEMPNFEPLWTAHQQMQYYCGLCGLDSTLRKEKSKELLEKVGLEKHIPERLSTFSQGMKKRFLLAVSMITSPKNYLLDETLNGIDPEGVRDVKKFILDGKKKGDCIFLSSHVLSEVEEICDKIAIIHHGKLIRVVGRSELSSSEKSSLIIEFSEPPTGIDRILEKYGKVNLEEHRVLISELTVGDDRVHEIIAELVAARMKITNFSVTKTSLEELFFKLITESDDSNKIR